MTSNIHPDFDIPWCKSLLQSDISIVEVPFQHPSHNDTPLKKGVSNSMFRHTLYTADAIRAQINFKRPATEADSITPWEYCYLMSLGSGIDGKAGRAHGGFNALVLDQMTGTVASMVSGSAAPATATMTVDYKAPIDTPGVVLCRSWAVERQGRKTWVKARIEDGQGNLLASAKSLFVDPRPQKI
ncbi:uncharacterized protein Z520_10296 [Fonsecaea multimorphosa CBS 102226]|uniref:Thioesterase domain-containing protein n=1 Tax=Fonsecaea multimorphosa CBS 102226 TaxID=1442371 RepID=A0A0D2JU24_9EURO|nr:uncharacterized protein Z520_10296 [Fonsecaea multimorphosa CBS 102226]KIX93959.1 hypothetical protein Z520_10296 [Fonsecaea multimorphosa CBS 102226]OAL19307.1 hypothetical protein AYO22_09851 [Fonsecaea multimorphosa]